MDQESVAGDLTKQGSIHPFSISPLTKGEKPEAEGVLNLGSIDDGKSISG
jgi:hypothetical protein